MLMIPLRSSLLCSTTKERPAKPPNGLLIQLTDAGIERTKLPLFAYWHCLGIMPQTYIVGLQKVNSKKFEYWCQLQIDENWFKSTYISFSIWFIFICYASLVWLKRLYYCFYFNNCGDDPSTKTLPVS